MDEAEPGKLKIWVKQIIEKNKDLQLSLQTFFEGTKDSYTEDEVVKMTNDAIRSVIGNKYSMDATQQKKIIELWETIHQPVIDYFLANMLEGKAFNAFHAILLSCLEFESYIVGNTNGIRKYLNRIVSSLWTRCMARWMMMNGKKYWVFLNPGCSIPSWI